MHVQTGTTDKRPRAGHPVVPELVGGVALQVAALRDAPDASQLAALADLISNAEYWLSFDLAAFEPHLERTPSPLRELGVGIALRFSDAVDGKLSPADLAAFREGVLPSLPEAMRKGLSEGLASLDRLIAARDAMERLQAEGFSLYKPQATLSVHALRASGRSTIRVDGDLPTGRGPRRVEIGRPVRLEALDERSRPLEAPTVETQGDPPIFARTPQDGKGREVVFLVPGWYRVRVPGKAEGDRRLLAI